MLGAAGNLMDVGGERDALRRWREVLRREDPREDLTLVREEVNARPIARQRRAAARDVADG